MRYGALDSLRGCAALTVVLSHCYVTYPELLRRSIHQFSDLLNPAIWKDPLFWAGYSPLRALWGGRPAVILFFVLSGFVLSLPFVSDRGRRASYAVYVIRRICRIYIPFVFAIGLSVGLYRLLGHPSIPALSDWFNYGNWSEPISARYVMAHLLMTGRTGDMTLDTVMWSLVHELRLSLIFPLLVWMTRKSRLAAVLFAILLYVVCDALETDRFEASLLNTGRFVLFFVIGIVIAQERDGIADRLKRLSRRWVALLWVIVAMSFMLPQSAPEVDLPYGIGAIIAITVAISSPESRAVLEKPALIRLGRISYSLYLIHVPILLAMVHLLYGRMPLIAILGCVIAASLAAAELVHVLIERPSMRLGYRLSGLIAPRPEPEPKPAVASEA